MPTINRRRTGWTTLIMGALTLIGVGIFACSLGSKQFFVFLFAFVGAIAGLLYSTLDHDNLTIKEMGAIDIDWMRGGYVALRVAIPTAIGYGASYMVLFNSAAPELMKQYGLAFAAAYIADASRLIVK